MRLWEKVDAKGKVILEKDAYHAIIVSCYRFANPSIMKSKWAEVQGILYGYNKDGIVHVTRAVPLAHLSSVAVEMDDNDYVLVAELEGEMASHDLFQVGWFHSHPGIKLFLSLEDVKTQAGLQAPNPLAIALVFNPIYLMERESDFGFKIFRLDDPSTIEIKFHEIPWEIAGTGDGFLKESKMLMHGVQRFLRGEGVFDTIQSRLDKTYKKMNSEIFGLKTYLQNKKKTATTEEIFNSFTKHKARIEKLFNKKRESIDIQVMLLDYLELKEMLQYKDRIDEIREEWKAYKQTFTELLMDVEKTIFDST
ncbi:hypothetical protein GF325_11815 [Candidatus Bathyarchaeota archaeon]|nr:hypothetical protein [Candidatus Bathyarchaeota archaeon]